jgi:hypothetical protein
MILYIGLRDLSIIICINMKNRDKPYSLESNITSTKNVLSRPKDEVRRLSASPRDSTEIHENRDEYGVNHQKKGGD